MDPFVDDDLTQDTHFSSTPGTSDRSSRLARVSAVLQTYATPKLRYDGMPAWELAQKILAVLDEPEPSDSTVRR